MATVYVLRKNGAVLKTYVKQGVSDIWELINGINDPQTQAHQQSRDWLLLLDKKDNPVIINKRYIFKIDEK